jgi:1,4-dihydroxy-2-naphthoate octaprenyltransferase
MENKERTPLLEFVQNSRPLSLLAGMLLYAMGAGIVAYRGDTIDWGVYWLGQAFVTLLQMSSSYLLVYYDRLQESPRRRDRSSNKPRSEQEARMARNIYLLAAITTLTIGAMLTVLLVGMGVFSPAGYVILGFAFLFAFFYAVPPLKLAHSGYGELIVAVLLTNLAPAFAYLLQVGELTELLGVLTLPLTMLYLAMSLALSLEYYFAEIKQGRQNLMIRLGWQRGMFLHNLCILIGYLSIGLTTVFGLPWSLTWPRLLTLPIGLFQVWQIWQIGLGAKPRWRLLRITAYATFAITVYMQAFTLWVK